MNRIAGRILCQHCHRHPISRPRGLCWGCFYNPVVRPLYPLTSKYANCGSGVGYNGLGKLPDVPTSARPGSEAKIIAMMGRASKRQILFHPLDAG